MVRVQKSERSVELGVRREECGDWIGNWNDGMEGQSRVECGE